MPTLAWVDGRIEWIATLTGWLASHEVISFEVNETITHVPVQVVWEWACHVVTRKTFPSKQACLLFNIFDAEISESVLGSQ